MGREPSGNAAVFTFFSPRNDRSAHMLALAARVSERIAALPRDEPVDTLARLSGLLSDVRGWSRQPDDEASAAVALIDPAIRAAYREASRRHVAGDRMPLSHPPADVHGVGQECLLRLAQTHQWLALPWTGGATPAPASHAKAGPVLARGVRACTAVSKWCYLFQSPVPAGLWADACRLLLAAEALGYSRTPVIVDADNPWHTSVEREFLKACMLAASGPERMAPAQLDAAERALEFCADALVLVAHEDRRLRFVIDLDDGEAPRVADGRFTEMSRSLGMNCYDVRLDDLIRQVTAGRMRASAFGSVLDQPLLLRTLLQMRARWTAHHH